MTLEVRAWSRRWRVRRRFPRSILLFLVVATSTPRYEHSGRAGRPTPDPGRTRRRGKDTPCGRGRGKILLRIWVRSRSMSRLPRREASSACSISSRGQLVWRGAMRRICHERSQLRSIAAPPSRARQLRASSRSGRGHRPDCWRAGCEPARAGHESLSAGHPRRACLSCLAVSTPEEIEHLSLEELRAHDAVALFEERARAVQHDFTVTPRTPPQSQPFAVVSTDCRLRLELAAARARMLAPAVLLARLDRPLEALAIRTTRFSRSTSVASGRARLELRPPDQEGTSALPPTWCAARIVFDRRGRGPERWHRARSAGCDLFVGEQIARSTRQHAASRRYGISALSIARGRARVRAGKTGSERRLRAAPTISSRST